MTEVKLGEKDRQTMSRLYEEMKSRRQEMAQIAVRAMSQEHPKAVAHFGKSGNTIAAPAFMLRWCLESSLEAVCLCYDLDEGVCRMCSSEEGIEI